MNRSADIPRVSFLEPQFSVDSCVALKIPSFIGVSGLNSKFLYGAKVQTDFIRKSQFRICGDVDAQVKALSINKRPESILFPDASAGRVVRG